MDPRVKIIGNQNSYANQILFELRDQHIQQDRLRFRTNLEKASGILAYELSKELSYRKETVTTPLGTLEMNLLAEQPMIVSILRAGITMHNGFLQMFDRADNGFISAYRHHTRGNEFIVKVEYMAVPDISGRDLILVDPMIASGKSILLSLKAILELGKPRSIYLASVIASEEGIQYVLRHAPKVNIYAIAVDDELTAKSYIVPGLGDAGDLAFGPK
jgi:uracil phosphoribosyltransferase